MAHEIRNRIIRQATPEERERHSAARREVERELPELKRWARQVAEEHRERIAVGTVLSAEESAVVEAIDNYAATHSLPGRSAVVREALSRLLGIEIARQ
jgi:hypothetical protein